ncbi:MAG: methionyl-tRNA formyltransferase [Acidimicrobiia bacterium]
MGAVFLGTPAAAVPSLAALADVEDVDLVVAQPDRPKGRGGAIVRGAVAQAADQFGFPVAQPATADELLDTLGDQTFAFGLVVAYGRILTPAMLGSTGRGFLNVHFSLLPRWRGAAPVERAIAHGDERTGVTLMRIDESLDTGPVLGEIATPIGADETGGSLTARLSFLGAALVDRTLPEYLAGRRTPVPQIDANTSHAKTLSKAEARLDPGWSALQAERTVRAFTPRPGTWMATPDGPLKVWEARHSAAEVLPGVIAKSGRDVVAGFSDGSLELVRVQSSGKGVLRAADWMNGRRGEPSSFVPEEE